MRVRTLGICGLTGLFACLAWIRVLSGQAANSSRGEQPAFQSTVQPFLARHCFTCHNEKLQSGNLNLERFRDDTPALQQAEVWDKVLEKLSTGRMPPPGSPAPDKTEISSVTAWIESLLERSGFSTTAEPGRVTARRLNRVEYNNTIRDLLGLNIRPADEFPVDDSGYGFDNIGDVLAVSPMLMEKYLAAANRISRLAIYGETLPPNPILLARLMPKKGHELAAAPASGLYLPYSIRGAMYGSFVFPVDAEYEFRVRIANYRGQDPNDLPPEVLEQRKRRIEELRRRRQQAQAGTPQEAPPVGALEGQPARRRGEVTPEEIARRQEEARKLFPPVKLVLSLDGKAILTDFVEGNVDYQYARGEFVVRVPVKAGEHVVRASFPELAGLEDPRKNINPDGRRKLYVDYTDIVGPFNPSLEPPESYKRIFICGHAQGGHQTQCARTVVENLIRRAYRRPVTKEEVDRKLRLVELAREEGDSLEEGIRLALQAILVSPQFLFRLEQDAKPDASGSGAARLINEHELASRLSYFLWASMPDEELMRAAGDGRLRQPGVLEAQVRRMLADPKAANLVENFAAQWLQLRNLGRTKPDPDRFPTVDDELLDAMKRETQLFMEALIREDRSVLDLIDAPFTFVNGPLARHYGMAGVSGEEFQRVALDGEQRGGLLTQAAVLTVSSYPTRTSPPVRGKWVLENLLGTPPPPPPADVPVLDETAVGTTVSLREKLEQHRRDPNCSACHDLMDPIGFGLESYDAVGAWRTHEGKFPIDTSGTLPDGKSFRGVKDLKQILRGQADAFTRNLTEKLLTYALGRGLERYDRATVEHISRQVAASNYRFSTLVLEIVNSKPFQMRSAEGGQQ
jgi:hypothetical protein